MENNLKKGDKIICNINPFLGYQSEIFEVYGECEGKDVRFYNQDKTESFTVPTARIKKDFNFEKYEN